MPGTLYFAGWSITRKSYMVTIKLLNTMGRRMILFLILIQSGNHLLSQSSEIETFDLRKNSVYLEFGDVTDMLSYSLKYERAFGLGNRHIHSMGFRTGLMVGQWYIGGNVFSIPVEGFYLVGKRLCFETGFTYAYCFGSPDFYAFGARIGLRLRYPSGILAGLAFTPTFANDGIESFLVRTYGISLGYSF